ncbi:hypothetical protein [Sphaerotilus mobilis]|uniref:Uncharacterized protein n=1 Tax=Sphaerotilus mobilis TaxID=47994 RepID=A0A4Q7LT74_9BURK|nr:hypothetical protein [Sphaerotilus mobilis]RZS58106.1 hypothetical protein EV685_0385 [Sphaerotilus mobilis]
MTTTFRARWGRWTRGLVLLATLALAACGGGGDSGRAFPDDDELAHANDEPKSPEQPSWTAPVQGSWRVHAQVAGGQVSFAPVVATADPPTPQTEPLRLAAWRLRLTLVDGQTVDHEVWPVDLDPPEIGRRDLRVLLPVPAAGLLELDLYDDQGRRLPKAQPQTLR